jgi:hypothetical protein
MAATTTPSKRTRAKSKTRPPRGAPRPITRDELEGLYPGLVEYLERTRPNFEEELGKLRRPRWSSPVPSGRLVAAGVRFDVEEVDRFLRFCRKLRHIKGRRFAGRPFVPDLWQVVFVIAPLFGWRRPDGTRLFRTLYLEVPRKNGKSTLCAAIALYLLTADREPGAEVYSAARDRDQARAVFDVARRMARASPALRRRLEIPKGATAKTIRYDATASIYTALSSDTSGAAKHGLNVHGVIIDELHVITDRELITTLETGTGSRDQPLVAYITTAGIPGESPVWEDKRDSGDQGRRGNRRARGLPHGHLRGGPEGRDRRLMGGPGGLGRREPRARDLAPSRLHRLEGGGGCDHPGEPQRVPSAASQRPVRRARRLAPSPDVGPLGVDRRRARPPRRPMLRRPRPRLEPRPRRARARLPRRDGPGPRRRRRFWTPEATLTKRAHRDRADYELWVREGWLTATPGETIDYDVIEADVGNLLASLAVGMRGDRLRPVGIEATPPAPRAGRREDLRAPAGLRVDLPAHEGSRAAHRRARTSGTAATRSCAGWSRTPSPFKTRPGTSSPTGSDRGPASTASSRSSWRSRRGNGRSLEAAPRTRSEGSRSSARPSVEGWSTSSRIPPSTLRPMRRRGWSRVALARTVIVNLDDGSAIRGVLLRETRRLLTLANAELLEKGAPALREARRRDRHRLRADPVRSDPST